MTVLARPLSHPEHRHPRRVAGSAHADPDQRDLRPRSPGQILKEYPAGEGIHLQRGGSHDPGRLPNEEFHGRQLRVERKLTGRGTYTHNDVRVAGGTHGSADRHPVDRIVSGRQLVRRILASGRGIQHRLPAVLVPGRLPVQKTMKLAFLVHDRQGPWEPNHDAAAQALRDLPLETALQRLKERLP